MSKTYTILPYGTILSALERLEAYIRPTYGPSGRAILVDQGAYQKMLDDGFLAIDEFELPDPLENAVIKFVKEASAKTNKRAGDGTTTATLLMIALVQECLKHNVLPDHIFSSLARGTAEAIRQITSTVRFIDSASDLASIAYGAYHDLESANVVANVIHEVGPEGIVSVESSDSLETTSKVVMGMHIPRGFYSPYLSNAEGKVELKNPHILLTTRRIASNADLLPILKQLYKTGEARPELIIVCESMEGEALTTCILNHIMVVQAPYRDTDKKDFLDDLAAVTGSTIADEAVGIGLRTLGLGALGTCEKVIVTQEETTILGGAGDLAALSRATLLLRDALAEKPSSDALTQRLARLTGGIGVIKVGAPTEAEMKTKLAKIDDAVHATQLAFRTGVVSGGGQAFLVETSCPELTTALKAPYATLMQNGTEHYSEDSEDALGVVLAALESGVSMATLLLNCGGIITNGHTSE